MGCKISFIKKIYKNIDVIDLSGAFRFKSNRNYKLAYGNSHKEPKLLKKSTYGLSEFNKKNIRTRCSAIILRGSNSILIDSSPDVRAQLLANNIKNISSVVYTHEHSDQTNGIFELRPFAFKKKGIFI